MVAGKLDDYVYADATQGVAQFKTIQSAHPMFGEKLLYTDIMKAVRAMRHGFSGPIATVYALGVAFNYNYVNSADAAHLDNHNTAHILADGFTFFTGDSKAAGYGNDVTLGPNGLKATENMTYPSREPNAGWKTFIGNDCEVGPPPRPAPPARS